jgi:hypothetical protein
MKQVEVNSKIFPPKETLSADESEVLVFYVGINKRVFEEGHHAVLQQEWHRQGTLIALCAAKSHIAC